MQGITIKNIEDFGFIYDPSICYLPNLGFIKEDEDDYYTSWRLEVDYGNIFHLARVHRGMDISLWNPWILDRNALEKWFNGIGIFKTNKVYLQHKKHRK